MLSWFDALGEDDHIAVLMAFANQQQKRERQAALEQWRAELQQRMAQADNPLTVTEEQKADVWAALLAHSNDKLPADHPSKLTTEDVERLGRLWLSVPDLVVVEHVMAKLRRIIGPSAELPAL